MDAGMDDGWNVKRCAMYFRSDRHTIVPPPPPHTHTHYFRNNIFNIDDSDECVFSLPYSEKQTNVTKFLIIDNEHGFAANQ